MRSHLSHIYIKLCGIQTRRLILSASIAFIISFALFPSTVFAGHSFLVVDFK